MRELIRGNLIETPALGRLRCLEGGYLALEDGIVRSVYDRLPDGWSEVPVTDYGDRLILQAFTDAHLHAPQYPMLGNGMDLPLLDWLNTHAFPVEARFSDPDYARRVYRALARELLDGGTTRVIMFSSLHTDSTLVLMEELEAAGLSGYVGKVNMDRNGGVNLQETTEESEAETLRWLAGCGRFKNIQPILTPRFTPSCTDELMAWLGELANERGLFVHSHLSENTGELALVKQLHPDCPQYWETYAKYGLWKDHTVMAHCVYSDERERRAMREANVLAVHCPDSNINISSGIAPVRQMLEEGVWVALGSDIAGGAQLNMLDVMTNAIRSSKARGLSTGDVPLTAPEAYYLGTSAGQRYFGAAPGFGLNEPLHAVVIDDSRLAPGGDKSSLPQRLERVLYRHDRASIDAVYAAGRKVRG
ncbi:MAG: amidohydrolase family protein [Candidatus Onthomonas sp.]